MGKAVHDIYAADLTTNGPRPGTAKRHAQVIAGKTARPKMGDHVLTPRRDNSAGAPVIVDAPGANRIVLRLRHPPRRLARPRTDAQSRWMSERPSRRSLLYGTDRRDRASRYRRLSFFAALFLAPLLAATGSSSSSSSSP